MGSFGGHAVPGGFFILAAFWWIVQYTYIKLALDNGRQKPRPGVLSCLHRAPIEAGLIIFGGMAGNVVEMAYSEPTMVLIDGDGHWANDVEWGHCTMYTYFVLYGVVKLLGSTCVPSAIPYEKAFGAMAYAVEGFLFFYHTHGRSSLDIHIHTMLVFAIFVCFLAAAGELLHPKDTLIRLIRILFTLVQGTWFWHLGIVLYRPPSGEPWDQEDNLNIMFITVMFTWHIFIDIMVLFIIYCITKLVLRICGLEYAKSATMDNCNDETKLKVLEET